MHVSPPAHWLLHASPMLPGKVDISGIPVATLRGGARSATLKPSWPVTDGGAPSSADGVEPRIENWQPAATTRSATANTLRTRVEYLAFESTAFNYGSPVTRVSSS